MRKTPENSARRQSTKAVWDQSSPQMGSSPNEVGKIAQHVRKGKEGKKETTDRIQNRQYSSQYRGDA